MGSEPVFPQDCSCDSALAKAVMKTFEDRHRDKSRARTLQGILDAARRVRNATKLSRNTWIFVGRIPGVRPSVPWWYCRECVHHIFTRGRPQCFRAWGDSLLTELWRGFTVGKHRFSMWLIDVHCMPFRIERICWNSSNNTCCASRTEHFSCNSGLRL
jgi:hypothetical protein